MKRTLILNKIPITVYRDAEEFTCDFFDIPEGTILDKDNLPETAGFACPEDNTIALFIGECKSFEELVSTVAHKLGHLNKNLYRFGSSDKEQERKAEFFENFGLCCYTISKEIYNQELRRVN